MAESEFPELQQVLDLIVKLVEAERGEETAKEFLVGQVNDVHVDVCKVFIGPFFLTKGFGGDPISVVRHAFHLSDNFDAERQRRTLHHINFLKHQLRATIQHLRELSPETLGEVIEQEYLDWLVAETEEEVHLEVEEPA